MGWSIHFNLCSTYRDGSMIVERGINDLTERYQNNPRQNRLGDSFVRFLYFNHKRP